MSEEMQMSYSNEAKELFKETLTEVLKAYMDLALISCQEAGLKEINFFKTPITTTEGGVYLLSLLHVDGPKIKVTEKKESQVIAKVVPPV